MAQQYTNGFEFNADSAVATCVELPAPPRGTLHRLVVKQVSSALDGFTVELLDRFDACAEVSEISNSFEGVTPATENKLLDTELHRIGPQIVVAGSSALYEAYDLQRSYQNRDEQDIRRTPNSRIYLRIVPGGAALSKVFQVAYTIEPIEN